MKNIFLFPVLFLFTVSCLAQEAPYIPAPDGSYDPVMTDEEATAGLTAGAGWSNEGMSYGLNFEFGMFGIITSLRGSISGGTFGSGEHRAGEMGLLLGYGHVKGRANTGFSIGLSRTSYKCVSSISDHCNPYNGGSFWGATGQFTCSVLLSDHTGLGILGFANLNKRSDLYGALMGFYYRL